MATCTAPSAASAEPIVRSFSVQDAKKAGLWDKRGRGSKSPGGCSRCAPGALPSATPSRTFCAASSPPRKPPTSRPATPSPAPPSSTPARPFAHPVAAKAAERPKPETPKRRTITEWLDALALELASCDGAELEEILARDEVQQAQDRFRNGAKDRLNHIIHEALKRTARADDAAEGELDPDNLFADPAADPFREVAPA